MALKSNRGRKSVSSKKVVGKIVSEYTMLSENIQKVSKEIGSSREKSRAFLERAGICTKNGSLRKAYR